MTRIGELPANITAQIIAGIYQTDNLPMDAVENYRIRVIPKKSLRRQRGVKRRIFRFNGFSTLSGTQRDSVQFDAKSRP